MEAILNKRSNMTFLSEWQKMIIPGDQVSQKSGNQFSESKTRSNWWPYWIGYDMIIHCCFTYLRVIKLFNFPIFLEKSSYSFLNSF